MPDSSHPREQLLLELEDLAEQATPGPWEAEVSVDLDAGEAHAAVVHYLPGTHRCVPVAGRGRELTEADQRFIAAVDPSTVLWLVREVRRLSRVEERFQRLFRHMRHLDAFLTRRGLQREAQRFASVQEHLSEIECS